jgi:hypothetical protein
MRVLKLVSLIAGTALAFSAGMGCQHNDAPVQSEITLDVKPLKESGSYVLDLRLTSHLDKPVEVYEANLPWGNWYSMMLIAAVYENGAGTEVLDHPGPIDDPGPTQMTIKPGEVLTGRVGLSRHFPDLDRIIESHDVIVTWNYLLRSVDGKAFARQSGSFVLPKE